MLTTAMFAREHEHPLPPEWVHFVALTQANTMVRSVDPSEYVERWDKGKI